MKTSVFSQVQLIILVVICGLVLLTGCTQDPELNAEVMLTAEKSAVSSVENLSENEISSLMYMVEEEKLAMDVYAEMLQLYGLVIFENINQSELRHVEALSNLIEKYGLENPIVDKLQGEFVNGELQQLYDDLITMGSVSKLQAINVGITIENNDIVDIQEYLDTVIESKDIEIVYTHLLNGSENHLAAFEHEL